MSILDPKSNDDNSTVQGDVASSMNNDDIQTPDPSQQVGTGAAGTGSTPSYEEPVSPMPESTLQPPVSSGAEEPNMPSEPTEDTTGGSTEDVTGQENTGTEPTMPSPDVTSGGSEEPDDNGGQSTQP